LVPGTCKKLELKIKIVILKNAQLLAQSQWLSFCILSQKDINFELTFWK